MCVSVWFRMVSVGFKRLCVCVCGSKWYLWALKGWVCVCVCVWFTMVSVGFKRLSVCVCVCVWFTMVSVGFKRLSVCVCVCGSQWYLWVLKG